VILAPRPELYDLADDPHELCNLYAERPALAERMTARLRAFERAESSPFGWSTSLADPDARARLASLGYTGAGRDLATADGDALPDPKDQIDLYNLITEGRALNAQGASAPQRRVP